VLASGPLGEQIALETSEISGCEYCRAARSFIGKNADKLPDETISRADMVEGPTPSPTSR